MGAANQTRPRVDSRVSTSATCVDKAGNSVSTTVSGIRIDRSAPNTTPTVAQPCTSGWYADFVEVNLSTVDHLSGAGTAWYTVDGGARSRTPGRATARDKAGNTATTSGRYHVNLYRFSGFPQPINDPSIQPGAPISVVKTGSTLPVKCQLRDMSGNLVQGRSAPQWLTPVRGGLTTAAVNEATGSDPGTTEGTFRWDATAQQYIYNWQTKGFTANRSYQVGVRLDDGQTFFVTVGLK